LLTRQANVERLREIAQLLGREQHGSRILDSSSTRLGVKVKQDNRGSAIGSRRMQERIDVAFFVGQVLRRKIRNQCDDSNHWCKESHAAQTNG
jgi:hypothetical protein